MSFIVEQPIAFGGVGYAHVTLSPGPVTFTFEDSAGQSWPVTVVHRFNTYFLALRGDLGMALGDGILSFLLEQHSWKVVDAIAPVLCIEAQPAIVEAYEIVVETP